MPPQSPDPANESLLPYLSADMEKQSLQAHNGPFDESHIPLQLGSKRRSAQACFGRVKSRWAGLAPALRRGLSLLFLAWVGVGLFSLFRGRGCHRCPKGVERWGQSGFEPVFVPALYTDSVFLSTSFETSGESETNYRSANATFPLDAHKSLKLDVAEGVQGEIVVSRLTADGSVDAEIQPQGKMVIETLWEADEVIELENGLGVWSDEWVDALYIKADSKAYHRIHLLLPPHIPVPSLSTNLAIRLASSSALDTDEDLITFTDLTLTSGGEGRNITGSYNVSRSIEFFTLTGDVDVDVTVVPPPKPGCHGPGGDGHHHHHGRKGKGGKKDREGKKHHGGELEQGEVEAAVREEDVWVQSEEEGGDRWWWPFKGDKSGKGGKHGRHSHDKPDGPPPHHKPHHGHGPSPPHGHPHGPPHGPPRGPPPHGPHGHPHDPPPRGPHRPHGPPPPAHIIAHSSTGSLTLRVHTSGINITTYHPNSPSGSSTHNHTRTVYPPVDIDTHTTSGSISITDDTFFGLFDAGTIRGKVDVKTKEEGKEIQVIREKVGETGGWVEGFVRHIRGNEVEREAETGMMDVADLSAQEEDDEEWSVVDRDEEQLEQRPEHGSDRPRPPRGPPPHDHHGPPPHDHHGPPPHGPPHGPPHHHPHGPPHHPPGPPHSPHSPHSPPPPPPGHSRVRAHTVVGDILLNL